MKVNYFEEPCIDTDYVDVHYQKMNEEVQGIIEYFAADRVINGKRDGVQRQIKPEEIYYCEIVDRKCYAYLNKEVYQIDCSIQNLLERYEAKGFVRIGKSMVVNIYKVQSLKMDLNMKVQIFLKNEETILLNRSYKKEFLDFLNKKSRSGEKEVQGENH